jgi:DHA3 family macrolide efflux protein-like MFS transporter
MQGPGGRPPRAPAPVLFLWGAQFCSQFGDSVFQIAFIWLILDLTGSKAATGGAATLSYLPSLLLGVVAGLAVDRLNRRRVMLSSDAIRATLLLAAAAFIFTGTLTAVGLTAIAFFVAAAAVFFYPARDSLLPELVSPDRLAGANAWVQLSQHAAFFIGPLVGGAFIQQFGVRSIFPLGAALFAGSLALLLGMGKVGRAHRVEGPRLGVMEDLKQGLRAIGRDRALVLLLALTGLDNLFIMGPAIVGNAVIVRETLGGSAADYALVEAAYGVAMIVGSLALARWGSALRPARVLLWGIVLDGLTYIPLYGCRSLAYLLFFSFVHALVIPIITVPRATLLQQLVPSRLLGRVFALVNVLVVGMTAVSSGLTGLVLERVTAPQLFGGIGILAALTGALGWSSRRLRRL